MAKQNSTPVEAGKSRSLFREFSKGIIKENPVLRLVLGTCPTLAVTTAASNAIGMGLAATLVLLCSNAVISALRHVIPDKIRIPAFITIIAGFVSVVQLLVKAFAPSLDESLGIYLPLIVVNCIILGRAEMFASKNKVLPSMLDGLGMGIGFTCTLLLMGSIREILGAGTWFGLSLTGGAIEPMLIFVLSPGGFFVFGLLVALANKLAGQDGEKQSAGCCGCPMQKSCAKLGDCTDADKAPADAARISPESSSAPDSAAPLNTSAEKISKEEAGNGNR